MQASGKPRGHPVVSAGQENPAADSKKFLREFFKRPEDRPKKCDNKKVQCGLKGLARGTEFPTVDPSHAPSGGPSSGPSGGAGGGGGAGPGAAAASAVPRRTAKETKMKFRKEMEVNQTKTAAPPVQMGSDPASLQGAFTKSKLGDRDDEPVEVDPREVEVMEEPSGEPVGEPSGCGCPSGPSGPPSPEEAPGPLGMEEEGEREEGVYGSTEHTADDMGGDEGGVAEGAVEVNEDDIEAMGDDEESVGMEPSGCVCVPAGEPSSAIPEVGEEEVEFLSEGEDEDESKAEAMYAAARTACQQGKANSDEPSAPSHSPSDEKAPWKDPSSQKEAATELVEVLTPIEALGDVDINDVELNLFNEESENPHYTVMVKGEPVAKIALADQTMPQGREEMFLIDEYPQAVLEGIEQFGLKDTLNTIHARYYASRAMEGAVATEMKKAAIADLEGQAKRHIAKIKDDLGNVAALVIEGSLKNYIVENPLRDALVQQIRSAGVDADAAVDLVENAFREAGSQYFTTILNKAEEWMGAPKEAMEHHIKEITGMNYRHPGYEVADTEDEIPEAVETEVAPQIATASIPKSVPLRTAAPQAQEQVHTANAELTGNWQVDRDAWKKRLNLFGHVASKSMANNMDKFRK